MAHSIAPDMQQVRVASGYDVVLVRQHVRQMAREAGFNLPSQARMTAVVSEIARVALEHHWNAHFTFRLSCHRGWNVIEVQCSSDSIRRTAIRWRISHTMSRRWLATMC
jgi:anti-sigma regulatory factor (Ser/Thr protein kinase)